MPLAVRARGDGKDRTMVCSHCKRTGHESENCFALIGYPEWWVIDREAMEKAEGTAGCSLVREVVEVVEEAGA